MSRIDLHIHTSYSGDGEFSPEEIVAQCRKQNMELIAITDHNSVRGVSEALKAATDICVISGVELDCTYSGRNFHLLGYCFDHTRREFDQIEQNILQQEKAAAEQKIQMFRMASGIPVVAEEVMKAAENGVVTGELIAQIVLAREDAQRYEILHPYLPGGAKSDMPNVRFYWDFFSEGKAAYVPIHYLSLTEAVELVHSAGGAAVLAHPGQNLAGDDALLKGIILENIDGIEVFSSYHSKETAQHYLEAAEQNNLFVTCGSDFHGEHKPSIQLGGHRAFWEDQKIMAGFRHCGNC